MKILHCCLAAFYIDGYGYQENILPRVHKRQGHDVAILASTETYIDNKELGYVEPCSYLTEDDIPITRLAYAGGMPHKLAAKLRFYKGLSREIEKFEPDILFLHDCQFLGVSEIVEYAKHRPDLRIYVDCHTDFVNSGRNWISKHILHGIIYKHCVRLIEPYVKKFYGVLPVRVDFLQDVYGTPPSKTELLVLGAEDEMIQWEKQGEIRKAIRKDLGIAEGDLLILCGGKIDRRKNIHTLMQAIAEISRPNVKLVVFGTPNEEMTVEFERLSESESIRAVGWLDATDVYDYLLAADLAVFPGTHSVLWEQAVGTGCPCVFRRWSGIEHIDVGGNCVFLENGSIDEIKKCLLEIIDDPRRLAEMKEAAVSLGIREFSYADIARRAIEA